MSKRELTEYERTNYLPLIKKVLDKISNTPDKEVENALNVYIEHIIKTYPEDFKDGKMTNPNLTKEIVCNNVVFSLTLAGLKSATKSSNKRVSRKARRK